MGDAARARFLCIGGASVPEISGRYVSVLSVYIPISFNFLFFRSEGGARAGDHVLNYTVSGSVDSVENVYSYTSGI